MVGMLVHGDNHFIVRGPLPDSRCCASADSTLVHHSDMSDNTPSLEKRRISTKEFREDAV
jgi:hypothetical protein